MAGEPRSLGQAGAGDGRSRALVIGIGNSERGDDGVAREVIGSLRCRLGLPPLGDDETGLDSLGAEVDTVAVLQLGPDLLDVATGYDRVLFVDAHVRPELADLDVAPVEPKYASAPFTHHMTPELFMALVQALYGRSPRGYAVSVRGSSFDFERGLSETVAALVAPAAERILRLLGHGENGA